ncbi:MAG: S1C family serine protease [Flavobacteriaceae bacterium]
MKKILFFLLVVSVFVANSQSLAELYKEVNSSVVVIDIISVAPEKTGDQIELVAQASQGSGVLISEDGLIWTASHVVQSAEEVQIEFLDGDIYEGEVLTSNEEADVALVKISQGFQLKNKKVAAIGDSDKAEIGEDVFVLGAPHGFKQSLSRGILSGRFSPEGLMNDFVKIEFLQTDASINPGNSGGPMFNMQGEVIGIASRIYTNSGGFEGIGFVMSSNVAYKLLMEEASLWGGMESMLVSGAIAAALNVPQESGLLVMNVSSKGAGGQLGIQGGYIPATIDGVDLVIGGDIILEMAGILVKDVNSLFEVRKKIANLPAGQDISMTILRNGKVGQGTFKKLQ